MSGGGQSNFFCIALCLLLELGVFGVDLVLFGVSFGVRGVKVRDIFIWDEYFASVDLVELLSVSLHSLKRHTTARLIPD